MYRIDNFIKYAQKYLGINVTDDQIKEVTFDIKGIREFEDKGSKNIKIMKRNGESIKLDTEKISNAILKSIEKVELEKDRRNSPKQIKLDRIYRYLDNREKHIIDDMLSSSYDLGLDSSVANYKYNNTINIAVEWSIPRIEKEYKRILNILKTLDIEEGELAKQTYKTLPKNQIDRIMELMKGIDHMQELIEIS